MAGRCEDVSAIRLYQAEYSLEAGQGDHEHDRRPAGPGQTSLPARLASLSQLTRIAAARSDRTVSARSFSPTPTRCCGRSDERMRMSASHTVVALAGGTGSGKSTLFNAMSGWSSACSVMRPTTRHSHACVWGIDGAAPLLDWLGVQRRHRYARASALSEGETSLTGLLLLDLPDHDSVVSGSAALVDRLVKMADMLVWVLDPLKYADASVHRRYLVPLGRAPRPDAPWSSTSPTRCRPTRSPTAPPTCAGCSIPKACWTRPSSSPRPPPAPAWQRAAPDAGQRGRRTPGGDRPHRVRHRRPAGPLRRLLG